MLSWSPLHHPHATLGELSGLTPLVWYGPVLWNTLHSYVSSLYAVAWGSYFDHLVEWNKYIDHERIMVISYEELKEVWHLTQSFLDGCTVQPS